MGGQKDDVAIPHNKVMHWNLSLRGKWMYERQDVESMIKMVETGIMRVDGTKHGLKVEGTFGLEGWKEAFDLADKTIDTGFVVIKP